MLLCVRADQSHLLYGQPQERSTCFALARSRVTSFPDAGVSLLPGSVGPLLPLSHLPPGYVTVRQLGTSMPLAPIANLAPATAGYASDASLAITTGEWRTGCRNVSSTNSNREVISQQGSKQIHWICKQNIIEIKFTFISVRGYFLLAQVIVAFSWLRGGVNHLHICTVLCIVGQTSMGVFPFEMSFVVSTAFRQALDMVGWECMAMFSLYGSYDWHWDRCDFEMFFFSCACRFVSVSACLCWSVVGIDRCSHD